MPSEFPDQLSVGKNVVLGTVPLGPVRQCQQDAPRPTNCAFSRCTYVLKTLQTSCFIQHTNS